MKKTQKTKKYMGILLVIAMLISGLTACQSTEDANVNGGTVEETVDQQRRENVDNKRGEKERPDFEQGFDGNINMGEITAIEGNTITVNAMGGRQFGGARPEGEAPKGEMPSEFEQGKMPEAEQMVIEVTEDTVITVNDENSEVSYLQVGDFIQFTMEDEVVTEIRVGMPQQGTPREDVPQQSAPQEKTE